MTKAPLGADLVIPLLALAFAAYFFVSIEDLAWEAKANGVFIGGALVLLVVVQIARIGVAIARGRGDFGTAPLWAPRDALGKRIGMVLVTIAFIATLKWLGLTLGLLLGMAASLWIMGVRRPGRIAAISIAVAASAYLLFILALDSNFPHGPVERAVAALRA
ncbi:MAG TPA: tripartite tricarboxylate transporter TctB family protein [Usitatibacter sp.]|nr:tripartite tricarboxylate transporter TctB family protein [Usitatibacter sp.]